MSEIKFEGLVEETAKPVINQQHKTVLDEAIKALKASPKSKGKLAITGNETEQLAEIKALKKTIRQLSKIDSVYKTIALSVKKSEKGNVYIKFKTKHKKGSDKKVDKTAIKNAIEMNKDQINLMQNMGKEMALKQYTEMIKQMQNQLQNPNIPETEKTKMKEAMQQMQKMIEEINNQK